MVTRISSSNGITQTKPSTDPLALEIQRLRAENEALKASATKKSTDSVSLKVSPSGCVSMYGLGRYPTSLRAFTKEGQWVGSQWFKVVTLSGGEGGALKAFIEANKADIMAKTAAHNAAKANSKGPSSLDDAEAL